MPLTIAVIAGIALLLPGLTSILLWNLRARRFAASRPDLPITAISVLTLAILGSLIAHLFAWYLFYSLTLFSVDVGRAMVEVLGNGVVLPSPMSNPVELMFKLARTGSLLPRELAGAALVLLLECAFIAALINDDGFDLILEGVDLGNQGWVYEHIVRPSLNGYRPVAYVLTNLQNEGLGVGYRGTVSDVRQGEKGETLAISLDEPERFLYEIKSGKEPGRFGRKGSPPTFVRHPDEYVGTVVALDARVIQNIVVSNPKASVLDQLDRLTGSDEGPERPIAEVTDA